MSGRGERLGRLLAIRRVSEELDRSALEIAMALVNEVEAEMNAQGTALAEARVTARAALDAGDRSEWLLADSQVEVAGWNRDKLKGLLAARTEAAGAAMEKFLESRREHEQVKQLVEDTRQIELVEENRKAQSAADDWFLSRRTREAS
jgi:flagellar biosynthesis chaperone FliJ